MTTPFDAAQHFCARLPDALEHLPGARLPWMRQRRLRAADELAERGFPTRKDEAWRYTDVSSLFDRVFEPAVAASEAPAPAGLERLWLDEPGSIRMVFLNGYLQPALSALNELPPGVLVDSVSRALGNDPELEQALQQTRASDPEDGFAMLNTAYGADGAFVRIGEQCVLERPIDLVYLSLPEEDPRSFHPVSWIELGAGARARISERFISLADGRYLTNARTRIQLGEAAELTHFRTQQEAGSAFHMGDLEVALQAEGRFTSHNLALGARMGRTAIHVRHQGEGAECHLNGLLLADDGQLLDFHTQVHHLAPGCTTRERFKGVLAGKGRGVFDGLIHVHPEAQKTDAQMSNDNLLLSRNAEVDTKPQLLIYADDVKCGHGATVGQLDPEALFYLRSRGIPEARARHLLTQGFAIDLLDAMPPGGMREAMQQALNERLEALHV